MRERTDGMNKTTEMIPTSAAELVALLRQVSAGDICRSDCPAWLADCCSGFGGCMCRQLLDLHDKIGLFLASEPEPEPEPNLNLLAKGIADALGSITQAPKKPERFVLGRRGPERELADQRRALARCLRLQEELKIAQIRIEGARDGYAILAGDIKAVWNSLAEYRSWKSRKERAGDVVRGLEWEIEHLRYLRIKADNILYYRLGIEAGHRIKFDDVTILIRKGAFEYGNADITIS